jgi:DNA-binding MarR family transcriptional regulator
MNSIRKNSDASDTIGQEYRDNFSRHLLGVTRHLQSETMAKLEQSCGHKQLRLGFEPYITLIGERGRRPSELAQLLDVSRQACNQVINQIDEAGYITRLTDNLDGRARQLALTPSGARLKRDGLDSIAQIDHEFAALVGKSGITDATGSLRKLHTGLGLGTTARELDRLPHPQFGVQLPAMRDYVLRRLMALTQSKGHPRLKLSFGQVLTLIGESGGRIQEIARIWNVSKQAISVIARELQALGYLQFDSDSRDARKVVLRFTPLGWTLIADSVSSMKQLEAEFEAIVGKARLKRLKGTFRRLYLALQLEVDIFEHNDNANIGLLAKKIQQQLGVGGSRELARLLLKPAILGGQKSGI